MIRECDTFAYLNENYERIKGRAEDLRARCNMAGFCTTCMYYKEPADWSHAEGAEYAQFCTYARKEKEI